MWINENAFISHLCCVCVCVVFVANYQQLFLQGRPYFRSVFNRGGNSEMARNGWREGGPQTDERRHCLGQLGGDRAQGTGKGVHVSTGKDSSNPNTLFFFFLSSSFFFQISKDVFFLSFFLSTVLSLRSCCPYSMHTIFSAWQKCWISTLEASTSMRIRAWFGTR